MIDACLRLIQSTSPLEESEATFFAFMGLRLALFPAKISFRSRDLHRFNKHGRKHWNAPLVDVVLQIVATPSRARSVY